MGIAAGIAAAGLATQVGGAIAGASSGGSSSPPQPNIYQPQHQPAQDQLFNQYQDYFFGGNPFQPNAQPTSTGPYGTVAGPHPQGYTPGDLYGFYQAQASNPYAAGMQNLAGTAGYYGQQVGGSGVTVGRQGLDTANNMIPWAQSIFQSGADNPYYQDAQTGAQRAGDMGMTLGQSLYSNALTLPGYGRAVLDTAFDPQGALYNRTAQQLTDQTRAGLEARGIDMSGAGQGLESQALSNFNIDWQNNQLGRQTQGLQAYQGALGSEAAIGGQGVQDFFQGSQLPYQTAMGRSKDLAGLYATTAQGAQGYGNLGTGSFNLGSQGVNAINAAGQMPYNAYQQIAQNPWTALGNYQNAYGNAINPYQQGIGNALTYMGQGAAAGGQQYQGQANAYAQNQAALQRQFQGLGQLGQALPGYANQFSSLFGSGGSSPSYAALHPGYFASGYNPSSFDYTAGGGDLMAA